MTYLEFLDKITPYAEEKFTAFQRKLIFTDRKILGIRTPILRKLAKECQGDLIDLLSFPNEYYETVFIKLTVISLLPYEEFVAHLAEGLALMDNWALVDCFKAKCIQSRKDEFLLLLDEVFQTGKEYFVRYVLVVLLFEYREEKYLPTIKSYLAKADTSSYYVYMAAAWLVAELLIHHYDFAVGLLNEGILDKKTHDKAIQKATESYRINQEKKEFLRSLKNKKR